MNGNVVKRIVGVGTALVFLLLLTLGLSFAFGGDPYDADLIGEPLDDDRKEDYIGTNLEFIAETGRIIYRENGSGEIIWDPPKLPTLRESVRMYREAVAKNDTGLVPLCSDSFFRYLKAARKTDESLVPNDPYFPACRAVPSGIYFGQPSEPGSRFSDNDHSGYNYQGTDVSEGINGAISIDSLSLDSGAWAAARFLMFRTWSGNDYWLEGGWAVNDDVWGDDDPHVYTQQCNSTETSCDWHKFDECNDPNNALVYIASGADNNWDSFCWNFDTEEWVMMWHDFDSGDDDADRLEAYFEVDDDQSGTISMGNVRFYNLELRDATTWQDWTTTYSSDTAKVQEGGYTVTTTSRYYDFYVSD